MIIMVENGALGNQIFQYVAIRQASNSRERIVLLGFDQLKEHFHFSKKVKFIHIQSSSLRHLRSINYSKLSAVTRYIPWVRVIGETSFAVLPTQRGLGIKIVYPSWFQNSRYFDTDSSNSLFPDNLFVSESEVVLESLGLDPHFLLALHIRAGDYRTWPSAEYPAIVSPEWFREQVATIRGNHPDIPVVAIGDDTEYIDEVLSEIPNSLNFSKEYGGDTQTDFGLLSVCHYAVISASSFALWARYFAHQYDTKSKTIAPNFWIGHATHTWYPEYLRPSFITFASTN